MFGGVPGLCPTLVLYCQRHGGALLCAAQLVRDAEEREALRVQRLDVDPGFERVVDVAHGCEAALESEAAHAFEMDLSKATVAIQGYGNAGMYAHQLVTEMFGSKVVAVSDSKGGDPRDDAAAVN